MSRVLSAGGPRKTRAEWHAIVAPMRADGMTVSDIARATGLSRSFVDAVLNDPEGVADRVRKERNRGRCVECGETTWSRQQQRCVPCDRKRKAAPHGTASRYKAGCSCDECRRANREAGRLLIGRPPPTHGLSGYTNYRCRCDICRRAGSDNNWLRKRRKAAE